MKKFFKTFLIGLCIISVVAVSLFAIPNPKKSNLYKNIKSKHPFELDSKKILQYKIFYPKEYKDNPNDFYVAYFSDDNIKEPKVIYAYFLRYDKEQKEWVLERKFAGVRAIYYLNEEALPVHPDDFDRVDGAHNSWDKKEEKNFYIKYVLTCIPNGSTLWELYHYAELLRYKGHIYLVRVHPGVEYIQQKSRRGY